MRTQVNHSGAEEGAEGRCTPPSHAPPMSFHQWALTTVLCFVSQLLLYSTEVSFCLYFMCSWTVLTPNGLQRCVSDSSKGATKVPEAPRRTQRMKFKTSRYSGAGGGISYTSLGRLDGVWKNPWPVHTSGRQGAWCQEQPQRNYAYHPVCADSFSPVISQTAYWAERVGHDYEQSAPQLQAQNTVSQASALTRWDTKSFLQIFSFLLWNTWHI